MNRSLGRQRWPRVQVRDLSIDRGLVGGPFGSSLGRKDYRPSGVPVIRGTNLAGASSFSADDYVYVSEAKAEELSRNLAIPGDLVLTQRGTLGQVGIVPDGPFARYIISQSQMRLRCDTAKAVSRFLYYVFKSLSMVEQILSRAITTGVPHINLGILGDLELLLPPLAEQRGIAATLGALDDKIESNRRTSALSRGLARARYVQACSGRTSSVPVGDVVTFHNSRRVPLSSLQRQAMPGEVPYYGATGVFGHVAKALFDQTLLLVGEDGSVVQQNGCPVTQYVWGPAWVNNHAHVLTGKGISTEVALLALERADIRPLITGAVQAKLSMGNLKRLLVAAPCGRGLQDLQEAVDPLFAIVRQRSDESRRLMALRDALLPELLSGRLRVPEAGEAVDQALV